jgi:hypothetical protein
MRTLFKWLLITAVVLLFFLMMLLGLGYLLKENEATTNQLKIKLNQEQQLAQKKEARKQALFQVRPENFATQKLTSFEQSQQKIIVNNLSCNTEKDCLVLHTNSKALGCVVTVNATGIAILLKTTSEQKNSQELINDCQQAYSQESSFKLTCQNNACTFAH